MQKVSIHDLKMNLARWTEKAARGEVVQVTKHNKPYVLLTPDLGGGLHWGSRVGTGVLKPAVKTKDASGGAWLDVLAEDRADK